MDAPSHPPLRVVVYGGDIAALETALALREHCGDRCGVTLLSPVRDLPIRTHAAGASPAEGHAARFDLGALAGEHELDFRSDAIVSVDPAGQEARTVTGAQVRYDALAIAFGARPRGALPGATTCWGTGDSGALQSLLVELRSGEASRVAFAIEAGTRWTLPTYELALTASRFVRLAGLEGPELSVVTYESRPAELLGPEASNTIAERLDRAGIELHAGSDPLAFQDRALALSGDRELEVDRVVAMAAVEGPRIAGLPRDSDGFLPVDEFGRVRGASRIWAAGEVTSYPVRQAGLAAQQAQVVAASIAAEAGIGVSAKPFRPVLRGRLSSRLELATGTAVNGNGSASSRLLWWPPEQLAGEHLSAHIAGKLEVHAPTGADSIPVTVELGPDGRRVAAGAA